MQTYWFPRIKRSTILAVATVMMALSLPPVSMSPAWAAELRVGGATVSITPDQPVALSGQMHTRISTNVETPCTATVLALESHDGDRVVDQAIMVSCDLIAIREGILEMVRERVEPKLQDFDVKKLFLSATHTHTAPVLVEGKYHLPSEGIIQPKAYVDFLADRVAEAVIRAWRTRSSGSAGWGLGYAVVGLNRRSVYADGTAVMYGTTSKSNFRGIEGYEDHGVEVLCFWDDKDQLFATAINIACPSQEVEGRSAVNADFWHQVRELLKQKYGENLLVLGWTGAAGDQSPHLMYRKAAEQRMRKLRGMDRLDDIARRIVNAWEEAYAGAKQDPHRDVTLVHKVETINLPERIVTDREADEIRGKIAGLSKDPTKHRRVLWHQSALDRHERQQAGDIEKYPMELHAIRLGDVAITTNSFELFTDFGIQIKSRSPALQTFIVQLAGPGTYLPSARAESGGGYSAIVESNLVGPEGGQVLTDHTIEVLNSLWP